MEENQTKTTSVELNAVFLFECLKHEVAAAPTTDKKQ